MTRVAIGTVTLNPAIDVTYDVRELRNDEVVRVRHVQARAGGKGVNVAAVAARLGVDATAVVLTGGRAGQELTDGLSALGLRHHALDALADVRRTVAVVADDGSVTSLQEPGYPVRDPGGLPSQVLDAVKNMLADGVAAVAVSGSAPPGCPVELPAQVAKLCGEHGVPVVVDTSGPALAAAASSGAVLTPNEAELADLLGAPVTDPVASSRELVQAGAPAVVVTRGRAGLLGVTARDAFTATPPQAVQGNATGAGDAAVAALLVHLASAADGKVATFEWRAALADMVATSAACVLSPTAGEIDVAAREQWLPRVEVRTLTAGEGDQ